MAPPHWLLCSRSRSAATPSRCAKGLPHAPPPLPICGAVDDGVIPPQMWGERHPSLGRGGGGSPQPSLRCGQPSRTARTSCAACNICGEEGGASCTQMLPTPALQDLRDVTGRQHWGVDPRPMTGASPPTFAAYYAGHPGGPGGLLAVACGGCRGGCPRIRFARGQLCATGMNLLWGYGLGGVKRCETDDRWCGNEAWAEPLKKGTPHSCMTFSPRSSSGP